MTEGEKLLDKADALLSKYREGVDFPVLTEVVEIQSSSSAQAPSPSTVSADDTLLNAELQALEERLRQNVLCGLQPYLDALLTEPLEVRIRAQLETAMAGVCSQVASAILSDISELAHKAVAEAVERELSSLRARISPP